jgi:hypothetical protein
MIVPDPNYRHDPYRHSGTARRKDHIEWMEKVSDEQYRAANGTQESRS